MNEENKEEKFELYLVCADVDTCLRHKERQGKIMGFHRNFFHHCRFSAEQKSCAMVVGKEGIVIPAALTETPSCSVCAHAGDESERDLICRQHRSAAGGLGDVVLAVHQLIKGADVAKDHFVFCNTEGKAQPLAVCEDLLKQRAGVDFPVHTEVCKDRICLCIEFAAAYRITDGGIGIASICRFQSTAFGTQRLAQQGFLLLDPAQDLRPFR